MRPSSRAASRYSGEQPSTQTTRVLRRGSAKGRPDSSTMENANTAVRCAPVRRLLRQGTHRSPLGACATMWATKGDDLRLDRGHEPRRVVGAPRGRGKDEVGHDAPELARIEVLWRRADHRQRPGTGAPIVELDS